MLSLRSTLSPLNDSFERDKMLRIFSMTDVLLIALQQWQQGFEAHAARAFEQHELAGYRMAG